MSAKFSSHVIPLGAEVTDSLTGFCGVVDSRQIGLHHAPRVRVISSTLQNGVPVEHWFEETRLVVSDVKARPMGFSPL